MGSTKNTSIKKVHIMDSVDILDRIDILLFQPVPGHFTVDFTCKEKGKQLVIDSHALNTMQAKITALCVERELSANDAKTRGYIEEFVGRLVREYHKADLAIIETIPEGIDDHYKHLRKQN
jgi:hypothetical protein